MENPLAWFLRTAATAQKESAKSEADILRELYRNKSNKQLAKDRLPPVDNHQEISIISPFYDRNKICKAANCSCPYHKRIKAQVMRKVKAQKTKCIVSTQQSPKRRQIQTNSKDVAQRSYRVSLLPRQTRQDKVVVEGGDKSKSDFRVKANNEQFQRFLRQNQQWLLKNKKLGLKDPHVIKNSVKEIFKYIYKNLREERHVVKQHIDNLVKDRDITDVYMTRYDELRQKLTERIQERKFKTAFDASKQGRADDDDLSSRGKTMTNFKGKKDSVCEGRGESTRKGGRNKSQRFIIQMMIDDIENGYQIEESQLQKLQKQPTEVILQNLHFLKRRIGRLDEQTLVQIRDNVLMKLSVKLTDYEENEQTLAKRQQIKAVIDMINARLQSMNSEDEGQDRMDVLSRPSIRSKKNQSNYSKKRESCFRRDTGYLKSLFKPQEGEENENDIEIEDDLAQEDKAKKIIQNLSESQQNRHKLGSFALEGEVKRKKDALQLARYRRLSHDLFFHKTFLNDDDDDYQPTIPKLPIETVEEIGSQLDFLASDLQTKFRTLKEIERKIEKVHLKELIINEQDCLLTAKRKARAFKKLLKDDTFTVDMKTQVKQYLTLIEQQNYVKNRKWAHKKFQHLLLGDNSIELFGSYAEEPENKNKMLQGLLADIFGLSSKLLYYDVSKTEYCEDEVNFQKGLFEYIHSKENKEEQTKRGAGGRQKTVFLKRSAKKKTMKSEKESDLIQVGLNNKCFSSYFGMQMNELMRDQENGFGDFDLMSSKREQTYIKLFQRLQQLG